MSRRFAIRFTTTATISLLLTALAGTSRGQITSIGSSDVEGFFGSTSDVYQQTENPNNYGSIPPWAPVGFAPPYGPAGLPLPPLYASYPNPTNTLTLNIPFPAPAGHAPGSPFTDGTTSADYHIFGGIGGSALYTRNAYARLGNNTANLMYLNQPSSATGYAYEEEEFAMQYNVGAAGLLAGATVNTRPYLIYGQFNPGGSAEFGAEVDYWFTPTSVNTITGVTVYGTPTLLGSLQYDYYLSSVSGPFVQLVPDTYGSNFLLGAAGTGILELTGDMFVIGDPVTMYVEAVPEPASMALLGMGVVGLVVAAGRRRRYGGCVIQSKSSQ